MLDRDSHLSRFAVSDAIGFRDLGFTYVAQVAYSSRGTPFTRLVPTGMPRIPPMMLDSVCYLYHSEEDAELGRDFGGTAFLIGVPTPWPDQAYIYAVSNWHVVCESGASVLRVNTHDGGTDIIPLGPENWDFDPRYDVAVAHFPYNPAIHRCSLLPLHGLALREHIEQHQIGPGDDVFMVGRFIDHDGGAVNRPAVRFGNISVMPSPIVQPNGKKTDAYCIDLHSRSGYSGSPVFAYRTPGYDLGEKVGEAIKDRKILLAGANYLACLGIHCSQFPEKWEVVDGKSDQNEADSVPLIRDGAYVKGLSGMTCVIPAWIIHEVLHMPKLVAQRVSSNFAEQARREGLGEDIPEAEVASRAGQDGDANPRHLEDFTHLVSAASKRQPQAD